MTVNLERLPEVSVVMPVFNVAAFVKLAVSSVLNQTLTDLELIVVDDGSTDGTVEALRSFCDKRLRIVTQLNAGSSAARNTGLKMSAAPYVAFIDGDDLWAPQKLALHTEFLHSHPDVDLSFSYSSVIDEDGASTGRFSRPVKGYISFRELLIENVVHNGSAVVLRREALDKAGWFDVALRSAVDHDVWLRVALTRPHNIYCISEFLTYYRIREGQITKDWRRMEQSWRTLIEKMRRLAPVDVGEVEMQARSHLYRYLAYIAYENGQYSESGSLLRTSLKRNLNHSLWDRRMWLLATALTARLVLPPKVHEKLDRFARDIRSHGESPTETEKQSRKSQGAH